MAKARATFGLPSFAPLSGVFYNVLNLMKFGEHRGGMYVGAHGVRDGQEIEQSWHLLAEGDDGPYIPSMAIEAITRKLLRGERPDNGARPAMRALDIEDYEKLFEGRTIYAGFRDTQSPDNPLYRQILGSAFETLPEQLKLLHGDAQTRKWVGHAKVRRGTGLIAKMIGQISGFPQAAESISVSVVLAPEQGGERWTRDFGGKVFSSLQKCGMGRNSYLVTEKFGFVEVALALVIEEDQLYLVPRRWSFLGVPLPSVLLPSGQSFETERDGRFCFDVEIATPFVGLIVAYHGVLELT